MVIPLLANQDLMPMFTNTIYTIEHRVLKFSYKMLHEAVFLNLYMHKFAQVTFIQCPSKYGP